MLEEKRLRALSAKLTSEPEDYMHSFRRNVGMYVEQKEITLQEIADLADISLSTLKSFLYNDSKDCTLSTAIRLAKVFGVSVDELVGCGTIAPQTCESLQTMRQLPESFTHFVRWAIHFHCDMLESQKVTEKAIEIMNVSVGEQGNLLMNNRFSVIDISNLSDDIRPKIFMGIRIPSNIYAPEYFESDILLLANDRSPRNGEHLVVCVNNNMWIVECRYERDENGCNQIKYHSIRNPERCKFPEDGEIIVGYVVKVHREER